MNENQKACVEMEAAVKRYGGVKAVDGVSLRVERGEVVALLGGNGAGKTTAMRLMLGLTRADSGRVRLFGRAPGERAARQQVGVMLQAGGVPATLRVREHVELFSSYYAAARPVEETLRLAGLTELAERPYGALSGGQQQRLLFGLAMCGRPGLLMLDEPTVGLDAGARRGLWKQVQGAAREGAAVLLSTHYLEEAEALATRVVVMNRGRVVAEGSAAELKARGAVGTLEDAFLQLTMEGEV